MGRNQRRFVVAMQECANKKEAAELIGLEPNTVYRWPAFVDEAVELLSQNIKETAAEILARNLAKAALVKVGGLDEDDPRVRQSVATEILDRGLGKVPNKNEITGADGAPLVERVVINVMGDDDGDD